ncbi:MAG: hypothetical protein ACW99L_17880 [Promethearchaeota archaeon]
MFQTLIFRTNSARSVYNPDDPSQMNMTMSINTIAWVSEIVSTHL